MKPCGLVRICKIWQRSRSQDDSGPNFSWSAHLSCAPLRLPLLMKMAMTLSAAWKCTLRHWILMDIITSVIISIIYVVLIRRTASILHTCRRQLMAESAIPLMIIHNLHQQQTRVGHAWLSSSRRHLLTDARTTTLTSDNLNTHDAKFQRKSFWIFRTCVNALGAGDREWEAPKYNCEAPCWQNVFHWRTQQ